MPTMRRPNSDLIEVSGELHGETERAYRFFDGATTVWLPKSQCEWDEQTSMLTIPEWLALEKGLI